MKFNIKTGKKTNVIEITDKVEEAVSNSDLEDGICMVFTPHTTAGIALMETWDEKLGSDLLDCLDDLISRGEWRHDSVDGNGAAHLKSAVLGESQVVPVSNGNLDLGQWQGIILAEFDGPRNRTVKVEIK